MTSIAIANSTINVPFRGAELYVVSHNGEPYAPMRPIIEGMGMDWASQFTKLKHRFKTSVVKITMQLPGDNQRRDVVCLALRKLAAWLNTISPNKVKPEVRERVIQYQEECDDVLYEYWTRGQVTNPRKLRQSTAKQLTPLRQTAERLITTGLGKIYPDIWRLVHQRFDVGHIHQLQPAQIGEAIQYLDALEGEYLQRGQCRAVSEPVRHRRVMLYLNEYGAVTNSLPIKDDEIVLTFETFAEMARRNGWIVARRDGVAKQLAEAIQAIK